VRRKRHGVRPRATGPDAGTLNAANSVEEQPEQQDHRNRHADKPQQDTLAHFDSPLLSKENDP
jgi:hypothetical protein